MTVSDVGFGYEVFVSPISVLVDLNVGVIVVTMRVFFAIIVVIVVAV